MKKILAALILLTLASCSYFYGDRTPMKKPKYDSTKNSEAQCLEYGFEEGSPEYKSCLNSDKVSDSAPAFKAIPSAKTTH